LLSQFLFECHADQRSLHSFPTRRSSDLEVETGAGRFHQTAQFVGEFIAAPVQQQRGATHAFVVFARRHQTDTGRTAAADLVLQARPRTVAEHAVLATAQLEQLVHQVERVAYRTDAGVRAEITTRDRTRAAVHRDPRPGFVGHQYVRVALVVA